MINVKFLNQFLKTHCNNWTGDMSRICDRLRIWFALLSCAWANQHKEDAGQHEHGTTSMSACQCTRKNTKSFHLSSNSNKYMEAHKCKCLSQGETGSPIRFSGFQATEVIQAANDRKQQLREMPAACFAQVQAGILRYKPSQAAEKDWKLLLRMQPRRLLKSSCSRSGMMASHRGHTAMPCVGNKQILRRSWMRQATCTQAQECRPALWPGEERRIWPHTSRN